MASSAEPDQVDSMCKTSQISSSTSKEAKRRTSGLFESIAALTSKSDRVSDVIKQDGGTIPEIRSDDVKTSTSCDSSDKKGLFDLFKFDDNGKFGSSSSGPSNEDKPLGSQSNAIEIMDDSGDECKSNNANTTVAARALKTQLKISSLQSILKNIKKEPIETVKETEDAEPSDVVVNKKVEQDSALGKSETEAPDRRESEGPDEKANSSFIHGSETLASSNQGSETTASFSQGSGTTASFNQRSGTHAFVNQGSGTPCDEGKSEVLDTNKDPDSSGESTSVQVGPGIPASFSQGSGTIGEEGKPEVLETKKDPDGGTESASVHVGTQSECASDSDKRLGRLENTVSQSESDLPMKKAPEHDEVDASVASTSSREVDVNDSSQILMRELDLDRGTGIKWKDIKVSVSNAKIHNLGDLCGRLRKPCIVVTRSEVEHRKDKLSRILYQRFSSKGRKDPAPLIVHDDNCDTIVPTVTELPVETAKKTLVDPVTVPLRKRRKTLFEKFKKTLHPKRRRRRKSRPASSEAVGKIKTTEITKSVQTKRKYDKRQPYVISDSLKQELRSFVFESHEDVCLSCIILRHRGSVASDHPYTKRRPRIRLNFRLSGERCRLCDVRADWMSKLDEKILDEGRAERCQSELVQGETGQSEVAQSELRLNEVVNMEDTDFRMFAEAESLAREVTTTEMNDCAEIVDIGLIPEDLCSLAALPRIRWRGNSENSDFELDTVDAIYAGDINQCISIVSSLNLDLVEKHELAERLSHCCPVCAEHNSRLAEDNLREMAESDSNSSDHGSNLSNSSLRPDSKDGKKSLRQDKTADHASVEAPDGLKVKAVENSLVEEKETADEDDPVKVIKEMVRRRSKECALDSDRLTEKEPIPDVSEPKSPKKSFFSSLGLCRKTPEDELNCDWVDRIAGNFDSEIRSKEVSTLDLRQLDNDSKTSDCDYDYSVGKIWCRNGRSLTPSNQNREQFGDDRSDVEQRPASCASAPKGGTILSLIDKLRGRLTVNEDTEVVQDSSPGLEDERNRALEEHQNEENKVDESGEPSRAESVVSRLKSSANLIAVDTFTPSSSFDTEDGEETMESSQNADTRSPSLSTLPIVVEPCETMTDVTTASSCVHSLSDLKDACAPCVVVSAETSAPSVTTVAMDASATSATLDVDTSPTTVAMDASATSATEAVHTCAPSVTEPVATSAPSLTASVDTNSPSVTAAADSSAPSSTVPVATSAPSVTAIVETSTPSAAVDTIGALVTATVDTSTPLVTEAVHTSTPSVTAAVDISAHSVTTVGLDSSSRSEVAIADATPTLVTSSSCCASSSPVSASPALASSHSSSCITIGSNIPSASPAPRLENTDSAPTSYCTSTNTNTNITTGAIGEASESSVVKSVLTFEPPNLTSTPRRPGIGSLIDRLKVRLDKPVLTEVEPTTVDSSDETSMDVSTKTNALDDSSESMEVAESSDDDLSEHNDSGSLSDSVVERIEAIDDSVMILDSKNSRFDDEVESEANREPDTASESETTDVIAAIKNIVQSRTNNPESKQVTNEIVRETHKKKSKTISELHASNSALPTRGGREDGNCSLSVNQDMKTCVVRENTEVLSSSKVMTADALRLKMMEDIDAALNSAVQCDQKHKAMKQDVIPSLKVLKDSLILPFPKTYCNDIENDVDSSFIVQIHSKLLCKDCQPNLIIRKGTSMVRNKMQHSARGDLALERVAGSGVTCNSSRTLQSLKPPHAQSAELDSDVRSTRTVPAASSSSTSTNNFKRVLSFSPKKVNNIQSMNAYASQKLPTPDDKQKPPTPNASPSPPISSPHRNIDGQDTSPISYSLLRMASSAQGENRGTPIVNGIPKRPFPTWSIWKKMAPNILSRSHARTCDKKDASSSGKTGKSKTVLLADNTLLDPVTKEPIAPGVEVKKGSKVFFLPIVRNPNGQVDTSGFQSALGQLNGNAPLLVKVPTSQTTLLSTIVGSLPPGSVVGPFGPSLPTTSQPSDIASGSSVASVSVPGIGGVSLDGVPRASVPLTRTSANRPMMMIANVPGTTRSYPTTTTSVPRTSSSFPMTRTSGPMAIPIVPTTTTSTPIMTSSLPVSTKYNLNKEGGEQAAKFAAGSVQQNSVSWKFLDSSTIPQNTTFLVSSISGKKIIIPQKFVVDPGAQAPPSHNVSSITTPQKSVFDSGVLSNGARPTPSTESSDVDSSHAEERMNNEIDSHGTESECKTSTTDKSIVRPRSSSATRSGSPCSPIPPPKSESESSINTENDCDQSEITKWVKKREEIIKHCEGVRLARDFAPFVSSKKKKRKRKSLAGEQSVFAPLENQDDSRSSSPQSKCEESRASSSESDDGYDDSGTVDDDDYDTPSATGIGAFIENKVAVKDQSSSKAVNVDLNFARRRPNISWNMDLSPERKKHIQIEEQYKLDMQEILRKAEHEKAVLAELDKVTHAHVRTHGKMPNEDNPMRKLFKKKYRNIDGRVDWEKVKSNVPDEFTPIKYNKWDCSRLRENEWMKVFCKQKPLRKKAEEMWDEMMKAGPQSADCKPNVANDDLPESSFTLTNTKTPSFSSECIGSEDSTRSANENVVSMSECDFDLKLHVHSSLWEKKFLGERARSKDDCVPVSHRSGSFSNDAVVKTEVDSTAAERTTDNEREDDSKEGIVDRDREHSTESLCDGMSTENEFSCVSYLASKSTADFRKYDAESRNRGLDDCKLPQRHIATVNTSRSTKAFSRTRKNSASPATEVDSEKLRVFMEHLDEVIEDVVNGKGDHNFDSNDENECSRRTKGPRSADSRDSPFDVGHLDEVIEDVLDDKGGHNSDSADVNNLASGRESIFDVLSKDVREEKRKKRKRKHQDDSLVVGDPGYDALNEVVKSTRLSPRCTTQRSKPIACTAKVSPIAVVKTEPKDVTDETPIGSTRSLRSSRQKLNSLLTGLGANSLSVDVKPEPLDTTDDMDEAAPEAVDTADTGDNVVQPARHARRVLRSRRKSDPVPDNSEVTSLKMTTSHRLRRSPRLGTEPEISPEKSNLDSNKVGDDDVDRHHHVPVIKTEPVDPPEEVEEESALEEKPAIKLTIKKEWLNYAPDDERRKRRKRHSKYKKHHKRKRSRMDADDPPSHSSANDPSLADTPSASDGPRSETTSLDRIALVSDPSVVSSPSVENELVLESSPSEVRSDNALGAVNIVHAPVDSSHHHHEEYVDRTLINSVDSPVQDSSKMIESWPDPDKIPMKNSDFKIETELDKALRTNPLLIEENTDLFSDDNSSDEESKIVVSRILQSKDLDSDDEKYVKPDTAFSPQVTNFDSPCHRANPPDEECGQSDNVSLEEASLLLQQVGLLNQVPLLP